MTLSLSDFTLSILPTWTWEVMSVNSVPVRYYSTYSVPLISPEQWSMKEAVRQISTSLTNMHILNIPIQRPSFSCSVATAYQNFPKETATSQQSRKARQQLKDDSIWSRLSSSRRPSVHPMCPQQLLLFLFCGTLYCSARYAQ